MRILVWLKDAIGRTKYEIVSDFRKDHIDSFVKVWARDECTGLGDAVESGYQFPNEAERFITQRRWWIPIDGKKSWSSWRPHSKYMAKEEAEKILPTMDTKHLHGPMQLRIKEYKRFKKDAK